MRVAELFESDDELEKPLIIELLENILRKGTPLFYVTMYEGALRLYQVIKIDSKVETFSPQAPSDIANTPFQSVYTRAPGYYSWETDEIGKGRGDIGFGLGYKLADNYHVMKLPSVQGRTDFIFGLRGFVKRWEREHAN